MIQGCPYRISCLYQYALEGSQNQTFHENYQPFSPELYLRLCMVCMCCGCVLEEGESGELGCRLVKFCWFGGGRGCTGASGCIVYWGWWWKLWTEKRKKIMIVLLLMTVWAKITLKTLISSGENDIELILLSKLTTNLTNKYKYSMFSNVPRWIPTIPYHLQLCVISFQKALIPQNQYQTKSKPLLTRSYKIFWQTWILFLILEVYIAIKKTTDSMNSTLAAII